MPARSLWGCVEGGGPIPQGVGEEWDWAEGLTFGAVTTEASADCLGCFEAGVSLWLTELRQETSVSIPTSGRHPGGRHRPEWGNFLCRPGVWGVGGGRWECGGWEEGAEGLGGWGEEGGGFQALIAVTAPGGWGDECLGPEQGPWWWISLCTNTLGSALCNIFTPSGIQASSREKRKFPLLTGLFLHRNFKRKVSVRDSSCSWPPPAPTTHLCSPHSQPAPLPVQTANWWQPSAPEPRVLPPAYPALLRLCVSTIGICQGSTHATMGHLDGEQILSRCPMWQQHFLPLMTRLFSTLFLAW